MLEFKKENSAAKEAGNFLWKILQVVIVVVGIAASVFVIYASCATYNAYCAENEFKWEQDPEPTIDQLRLSALENGIFLSKELVFEVQSTGDKEAYNELAAQIETN